MRYVAVTNAPVIINAFGDPHFVFNCDYDFKERFAGEPEYFANKGEQKGLLLSTNFVADAINLRFSPPRSAARAATHALQHGEGLDEQPRLPVPRRHLQEARPRARRARHRAHRRRL